MIEQHIRCHLAFVHQKKAAVFSLANQSTVQPSGRQIVLVLIAMFAVLLFDSSLAMLF